MMIKKINQISSPTTAQIFPPSLQHNSSNHSVHNNDAFTSSQTRFGNDLFIKPDNNINFTDREKKRHFCT